MELIREADRLGYYAVWTAEAYGSDAVSPLAWIGAQTERIHLGTAILQMAARSPAMTAMTAMTLDQLSGGRMLLGLGVSGPQVVEGWHGVGYARPLARTREYIEVVRRIFAREEPLTFEGEFYQLPYQGPGSLGAGQTAEEHPARAGGSCRSTWLRLVRRMWNWPQSWPMAGCRSSSHRSITPRRSPRL